MKTTIKNLSVFVSICVVITLLLSLTNSFTAPIIEKNQAAAANQALLEVMPNGSGFELVDLSTYTLPATVTEVQKETSGQGHVITLTTAGYGTDMVIMCGVDASGVVTGAVCLSSNETLGEEKTYGANFSGKDAAAVEAVDTVSGVTKTTAAYKSAIQDALNTAIILGGGSVDIRTDEQILADNLAAALPAGDSFEKLFLVEIIENVDAVYQAANGAGYVFVQGEQFVGVSADGTVLTEGADAALSEAVALIQGTTFEDIDISAYPDLEKYLVSAKKTASGNLVLETKGAGYGIKGGDEYHPASGEYIIVRVALSPDGQIIDCLTVSQAETANLGDACASESFYGQFVGKTEADYTEIDAISGATLTTDGYKQAIERAYLAFHAMNGGAQ